MSAGGGLRGVAFALVLFAGLFSARSAAAINCGCTASAFSACRAAHICSGVTCNFTCLAGTCQNCAEPDLVKCVVTTPYSNTTACTSDNNPCTSDVCNGAGACSHPNPTGGSVCGASCISPGTCCNAPDSCTGGKVCSGPGGSCACVPGQYDCGGTCITSGTCCDNPSNCPAPVGGNGSGTCSAPGGSCSYTCNSGYKACGTACIPNAMCCNNADCPNDPGNNRSGICTGGGCAYQCNAGYKACGGTCIASTACCASSECVSPPNGCYKTQGSCSAGACSYALNNGAPCNADSNACTPNDKCNGGSCVADTANQVVCVQRTCHGAPSCNPATGNCDDTNLPDATVCGGNGCTAAGACTAGVCSSPDKDCSALNQVCKVGICDPALPMATNCTTTNKMNGIACPLADKCQLTPACSGGVCTGAPKACSPSGACRVAECNSATGDCDETVAPVGTPCAMAGSCTQNAVCGATGTCSGDPVPDGSPCELAGCTGSASCVTGACTCSLVPDFGAEPQPLPPTEGADLGADPIEGGEAGGCAIVQARSATAGALSGLSLLLGVLIFLLRALETRRRPRTARPT